MKNVSETHRTTAGNTGKSDSRSVEINYFAYKCQHLNSYWCGFSIPRHHEILSGQRYPTNMSKTSSSNLFKYC